MNESHFVRALNPNVHVEMRSCSDCLQLVERERLSSFVIETYVEGDDIHPGNSRNLFINYGARLTFSDLVYEKRISL